MEDESTELEEKEERKKLKEEEIKKVLRKMKLRKAAGIDGIPTEENMQEKDYGRSWYL